MTDLSPAAQAVRDAVLAPYADNIPMDSNTFKELVLAETAKAKKSNQWENSEYRELYELNNKAKGGVGENTSAVVEGCEANSPFSGSTDLSNGDEAKLVCVSARGTYKLNRIKAYTDKINLVVVHPAYLEYRRTTRARLAASGKMTQQGSGNGDQWVTLTRYQLELHTDLIITTK
jgi:hypothetical protein